MRYFYSLLICAMLSLVVACSNVNTVESIPEPVSRALIEDYKIGVGDVVQVSVWRNADLSVNVVVRPDGKISVPLVGDVLVQDKTTETIAKKLETGLSDFIRNPKVTVIVSNPVSAEYHRRVLITGAVNNQRSIPFREGMTVLDLVLQAGGLSQFADGNATKLFRKTEEGVKIYPVYIEDILEKGAVDSNFLLAPQDLVTVPERLF